MRHSIDVMHVEKNVCDSIIRTLLDIKGKTKDGLNSRNNMMEMGMRPALSPQIRAGNRVFLPPACYTLSKAEKQKLCTCLRGIKVPFGYSSNVRTLVSIKDLN